MPFLRAASVVRRLSLYCRHGSAPPRGLSCDDAESGVWAGRVRLRVALFAVAASGPGARSTRASEKTAWNGYWLAGFRGRLGWLFYLLLRRRTRRLCGWCADALRAGHRFRGILWLRCLQRRCRDSMRWFTWPGKALWDAGPRKRKRRSARVVYREPATWRPRWHRARPSRPCWCVHRRSGSTGIGATNFYAKIARLGRDFCPRFAASGRTPAGLPPKQASAP